MVQRVWGQINRIGLGHRTYIATGRSQVEVIQSQLGDDTQIIVEPNRRDTFPAIALAAVYLYSKQYVALNEVVAVLPVDPYVEDRFFTKVMELERGLNSAEADIGLLGVSPTYPSEKYGYIVPKKSGDTPYRQVSHFEEKPTEARARLLINQGALWNCGVFAFRLEYIINELIARRLPVQYDELLKQYNRLNKISFDYEIVEKANKVIVLPYDGYWKDLGTWNTLTEEMGSRLIGNATVSDDSYDTHVINELDIPLTVLGISNAVIAASPDGILVSDKAASPRIKDLMQHQEQRPMYEERRWGRYRVLDYITYPNGQQVLTKRIMITSGNSLSYQMHRHRREVWTVISGSGEMVMDGKLSPVTMGTVVVIQPNMKHSIRALTDLEIIEVQTGDELVEEDVVRLEMKWSDIIRKHVESSSILKEV